MSQFINGTKEYDIVTQNELSVILASFETSYIFAVIKDNLAMRYNSNFIGITKPNTVGAFENTFKNLKEIYPVDHENIDFTRQETYSEIIELLSNEYHFTPSPLQDSLVDKFPLAYYMYDFFVSNFSNYITRFFSQYIFREKNAIYNYFNLENLKKNKDSSTVYGRRAYEDPKLAIINANLVYILDQMQAFDISFRDICSIIYTDPTVVELLNQNLCPQSDFYKEFYCEAIRNKDIAPLFLTSIRLEIQKQQ